ncbi:MAG: hypothetical protein IJ814_00595 [Paludibacteraceae bacterium]|nr:hypothetical protein [Paludibacteraceae bacterium]
MKKLVLLAAVAVCTLAANAATWRINSNPAAKPDFLSLKAACDSDYVAIGDTLYCEPAEYNVSEENTITKKGLVLIGPGFNFKNNYGGISTIAEATFSAAINLREDSIQIEGVKAAEIILWESRKDIVIERCYLGKVRTGDSYRNQKRIAIRSNYFPANYGPGYERIIFSNQNEASEIDIENNIIIVDPHGINLTTTYGTALSAVIAHNTIIDIYQADNFPVLATSHSEIRDNIFIQKYGKKGFLYLDQLVNCQIYNNVWSMVEADVTAEVYAQYGADNYFIGATEENTFTCQQVGGASETYYQLKEGSVAAGKAYQHEDCGAFAGTWPFVINGRPLGVPYIYDVVAPHRPENDVLTITFKVKANNE